MNSEPQERAPFCDRNNNEAGQSLVGLGLVEHQIWWSPFILMPLIVLVNGGKRVEGPRSG